MATGDDLELGASNSANHETALIAIAAHAAGLIVTNAGASSTASPATGLRGEADVGVRGVGGRIGVAGDSTGDGTGVKGKATSGRGVLGEAKAGIGVEGTSTASNPGVRGFSGRGNGVHGKSEANNATNAGVRGESTRSNGVRGTSRDRIGVRGDSVKSTGVHGQGATGVFGTSTASGTGVHGTGFWGVFGEGALGVFGTSSEKSGTGVLGVGPAIGVWGGSTQIGVYGSTGSKSGLAGRFDGDVFIAGDLTKTGALSAAVPFPDGSLRRLYAIESPESWFEDFGETRLTNGRATVKIDAGFAAVVRGGYHVFVPPYGDSNGLYVTQRSRRGFVVREQNGGKSSIAFSYRVVAKRKDIAGPRLPKVTRPPKVERPR